MRCWGGNSVNDFGGAENILSVGQNQIELEVYDQNGGLGALLDTVSRSFTVVDDLTGQVVDVGLYDAGTDQRIATITDGSTIDVTQFNNLSVVVFVLDSSPLANQVESVQLDLNNGQVIQGENNEPYALFGDRNQGQNIIGGTIGAGSNSLELKLFSENQLGGTLLDTINVDFELI